MHYIIPHYTIPHCTTLHNAQQCTVWHSTAQHYTAQSDTTQHDMALDYITRHYTTLTNTVHLLYDLVQCLINDLCDFVHIGFLDSLQTDSIASFLSIALVSANVHVPVRDGNEGKSKSLKVRVWGLQEAYGGILEQRPSGGQGAKPPEAESFFCI